MSESNRNKSQPNLLSVEEMWSLVKGGDNWGIEGYEVPRKYFDYNNAKWKKEVQEMVKKPRAEWPPKNWPKDKETDKPYPPKRPNYLDQVYKWANSFHDPKRAEEVKQLLEEKGHPLDKPKEPPKKDEKRKKFLEYEEEKRKKKEEKKEIPYWKEEAVTAIIDKTKEDEKNKITGVAKIREKYGRFGSLPKCDRITVVSDAEHLGEKNPFYNTAVKPEEDDQEEGKNKKKQKKLFYPSVSIY
jgi:hypothetical protein